MEAARADAERIRLIGGSEAAAIEAVGKAEAERMRLKAAAYKQYGDAAMLHLVMETLPKVRVTQLPLLLGASFFSFNFFNKKSVELFVVIDLFVTTVCLGLIIFLI